MGCVSHIIQLGKKKKKSYFLSYPPQIHRFGFLSKSVTELFLPWKVSRSGNPKTQVFQGILYINKKVTCLHRFGKCWLKQTQEGNIVISLSLGQCTKRCSVNFRVWEMLNLSPLPLQYPTVVRIIHQVDKDRKWTHYGLCIWHKDSAGHSSTNKAHMRGICK